MIDLHIHSNVTKPLDGGDSSPSQIVEEAKRIGLYALALTDHDSVTGLPEASKKAKEIGINFVPGVEIACNFNEIEIEVVALGVKFETADTLLTKSLEQIIEEKNDFIKRARKRATDLGYEIPEIIFTENDRFTDELHEIVFQSYKIEANRKHFQNVFGFYPDTESVWYKTLFAPARPARVTKDIRTLEEAINITHQSGGKAFLAHPKRADGNLAYLPDDFIKEAMGKGLDGLECIHSKIIPKDSVLLMRMCQENGWLMTGGSDTHGLSVLKDWNERLNIPDSFIDWYSF